MLTLSGIGKAAIYYDQQPSDVTSAVIAENDVGKTNWFYPHIGTAYDDILFLSKARVMEGKDHFNPDAPIRSSEAAITLTQSVHPWQRVLLDSA